jgi:hypothetical protein
MLETLHRLVQCLGTLTEEVLEPGYRPTLVRQPVHFSTLELPEGDQVAGWLHRHGSDEVMEDDEPLVRTGRLLAIKEHLAVLDVDGVVLSQHGDPEVPIVVRWWNPRGSVYLVSIHVP